MTRLLITTNLRSAPPGVASGWLYVFDLETHTLLQATEGTEAPYRSSDHNPRGGMRGMRGFGFHENELAIADYSAIFFFDRNWNLVQAISHPSVSGIHEILYTDHGVWATSTANDLLVRFDRDGNLCEFHYLRAQRELMSRLGGPQKLLLRHDDILNGGHDFRRRTYFKSDLYDRVHLNSLTRSPDGRLFLSLGLIVGDYFGFLINLKTLMKSYNLWDSFTSLNRFTRRLVGIDKKMLSELVVQPAQGTSAIVSLDAGGHWQDHIHFPVAQNPSHSVRILEDGTCVYLDTSHGSVMHFDLEGHLLSNTHVSEKFLRGLLVLRDGRLLVGAGNTILVFDLTGKKVITQFDIDRDPQNTIFEIQLLPVEFDLPPASLQKKTGRITGFEGRSILWGRPDELM